jgi:hypothetical protein
MKTGVTKQQIHIKVEMVNFLIPHFSCVKKIRYRS